MKYKDIEVGQTAELLRTVKYRDVLDFMMMSGDKNDIHTDEKFAQAKGFKQPIVHGMFMGALISAVMGNQLPGNGTLWKSQSLQFIKPVFIGDSLRVRVEVKSKHDKDHSIVLMTDVLNQKEEVVVYGLATVKMIE